MLFPPSPNYDDRTLPISMLVLHYTGMRTGEEALARLCEPTSKVSAHYLVEEDGRILPLVNEQNRAWHAGKSYWRGITDVNSASISIEIVNPGHEFGLSPFPAAQMEAVKNLCRDIITRYSILPCNVVGHSDIAPERKQDPGELFDWQWMAAAGIGLWPQPGFGIQDSGFRENLTTYGYDPHASQEAVITAFQRHFRPTALTGIWDEECGRILAALLEMV